MQDNDLEKLFASMNNVQPDEAKKKANIKAALDSFSQARNVQEANATKKSSFFQGLFKWNRQTDETQNNQRKSIMAYLFDSTNNRLVYGSLATSCVVLLGVFFAVNMPVTTQLDDEHFEISDFSVPATPAQEADAAAAFATEEAATFGTKAHHSFEAQPPTEEEVVVTGVRESLQTPVKLKRSASGSVDAISAEDIGQYPDSNLAESLQRITGVSIDRTNPAAKPLVGEPIDIQPKQSKEYRDQFENIETNPIKRVLDSPVSTFSIDVDTASYSFARRSLNRGALPPKDAIRVEEFINYFDYAYPIPNDKRTPFSTSVNVVQSPWNSANKLVHIGIKGYEISANSKPKSNLVFLLDVSGSMDAQDKLPLVKQSMNLLLNELNPDDTVAIAVYAGAAGTVLKPTQVKNKQKILDAMQNLTAGGSTSGAQGIKLAYQLAQANFEKDSVNRIILATDGDFNVGITNREHLKDFVERKREAGIYLSVLGFGQGNYNDHLMQDLAQNGNGIAAYIDTLSEAQKVLVNEATGSLFTIAKDVKVQVEFNPNTVSEYRLIGYETRHLNQSDFNNDKVDAGDIGAGHTVTAIYEVTPKNSTGQLIEPSRYSPTHSDSEINQTEYGFLKLRYKLPESESSKLIETPILINPKTPNNSLAREIDFSIAVASFAQLLKDGKYLNNWSFEDAISLAQKNKGDDKFGYRTEFIQLIRKAKIATKI